MKNFIQKVTVWKLWSMFWPRRNSKGAHCFPDSASFPPLVQSSTSSLHKADLFLTDCQQPQGAGSYSSWSPARSKVALAIIPCADSTERSEATAATSWRFLKWNGMPVGTSDTSLGSALTLQKWYKTMSSCFGRSEISVFCGSVDGQRTC